MAKNIKNQLKKPQVWLANKIKLIRRVGKPMAARLGRWGGPSSIALIFFLIVVSWLSPQSESQKLKGQLLKNPQDLNSQLKLTEIFLENHQFEEAEKILLLTGKNQNDTQIKELWQEKHLSDPEDIQKLIVFWEKIVVEKPGYRDGYLQLAVLNYKLWQNEKAQAYLKKALLVDPNFEATLKLKQLVSLL